MKVCVCVSASLDNLKCMPTFVVVLSSLCWKHMYTHVRNKLVLVFVWRQTASQRKVLRTDAIHPPPPSWCRFNQSINQSIDCGNVVDVVSTQDYGIASNMWTTSFSMSPKPALMPLRATHSMFHLFFPPTPAGRMYSVLIT